MYGFPPQMLYYIIMITLAVFLHDALCKCMSVLLTLKPNETIKCNLQFTCINCFLLKSGIIR